MPKNDPALSFPVRGVAGGWRDCWDDPDDHAELRDRAEVIARCSLVRAQELGRLWREEDPHAAARGTVTVASAARSSLRPNQR
jgi:hypothetical protein